MQVLVNIEIFCNCTTQLQSKPGQNFHSSCLHWTKNFLRYKSNFSIVCGFKVNLEKKEFGIAAPQVPSGQGRLKRLAP